MPPMSIIYMNLTLTLISAQILGVCTYMYTHMCACTCMYKHLVSRVKPYIVCFGHGHSIWYES